MLFLPWECCWIASPIHQSPCAAILICGNIGIKPHPVFLQRHEATSWLRFNVPLIVNDSSLRIVGFGSLRYLFLHQSLSRAPNLSRYRDVSSFGIPQTFHGIQLALLFTLYQSAEYQRLELWIVGIESLSATFSEMESRILNPSRSSSSCVILTKTTKDTVSYWLFYFLMLLWIASAITNLSLPKESQESLGNLVTENHAQGSWSHHLWPYQPWIVVLPVRIWSPKMRVYFGAKYTRPSMWPIQE